MSEPELKPLPIMMSGKNPRLILDREKTVTRRPLKIQPAEKAQTGMLDKERPFAPAFDEIDGPKGHPIIVAEWQQPPTEDDPSWHDIQVQCPYWQGPGTRLYVKEPYALARNSADSIVYRADGQCGFIDTRGVLSCCGWLEDTTEPDQLPPERFERKLFKNWTPGMYLPRRFSRIMITPTNIGLEQLSQISDHQARLEGCDDRAAFLAIWDSLYSEGPNSVAADPWVWVVTFALAQDVDREAERTERRSDARYQDALRKIPAYQTRTAVSPTSEVSVINAGVHGCSHVFDTDPYRGVEICRYCERTIKKVPVPASTSYERESS